jgi:hypothetical protein
VRWGEVGRGGVRWEGGSLSRLEVHTQFHSMNILYDALIIPVGCGGTRHDGMVWCGVVWHGMVWHGMAWHGMVWQVCYGMGRERDETRTGRERDGTGRAVGVPMVVRISSSILKCSGAPIEPARFFSALGEQR